MALSKIDVANMLTGATPVANGGTALTSGFVNGYTGAATTFRITANFANDADPIASNWEEADTDGYGRLGTAVSQSSGIFTFPSTGIWLILLNFSFDEGGGGADTSMHAYINTTTDNSSYGVAAEGRASYTGSNARQGADCSFIFDVTDTTTHKVSTAVNGLESSNNTMGSTSQNTSSISFIRLGDT
jgi:hypothetical protein